MIFICSRQQEVIEQKQVRVDTLTAELEASKAARHQLEDGLHLMEDRLRHLQDELDLQRKAHEATASELTEANNVNSQMKAVLKILESPKQEEKKSRSPATERDRGPSLERLVTEVSQCNNFISRLQDKVQALETDLEARDLVVEQLTARLTAAQAAASAGTGADSASAGSGASKESSVPWDEEEEEELPGSLSDMGKKGTNNDDAVKYQFLKR